MDHPMIDASEINVQIKDGEVTLTGTVDSREAKRMAEDIAEECSGVQEVQNQLRVRKSNGSDGGSQGMGESRTTSTGQAQRTGTQTKSQ
jgi:hypothetical protein